MTNVEAETRLSSGGRTGHNSEAAALSLRGGPRHVSRHRLFELPANGRPQVPTHEKPDGDLMLDTAETFQMVDAP